MRQHTTHHDDCGCLSARYKAEIAGLRKRLKIAEEALERFTLCRRPEEPACCICADVASDALAAIRKE